MLLDDHKGEQFGESLKEGEGEFLKDFNPRFQDAAHIWSSRKDLENPNPLPPRFGQSRLAKLLNELFD